MPGPSTPFVRIERRDPGSGALVRLIDLTHPDSTRKPGCIVESRSVSGEPVRVRTLRWGTECVDHDEVCPHERLDDARVAVADPADWCSGCARKETP